MTLTEAARFSRKVLFWGAIVIILFVFLRITIGVGTSIFRQVFPKPTPPPTVAFGKITPPDFSQNTIQDSSGVSYSLQTIEGGLPNLGNLGKVFKAEEKQPTIVFGERARSQATRLKFAPEPQNLSERLYVFSDPVNPARKLELDVISGNLKIKNDIKQYPELLPMTGILNKEDGIRAAQSFLNQFEPPQKDLPVDKITLTPLKIEGGQLIPAKSLSEAQVIRVNFARAKLEKLPILPVDFEKQNIWVEVTPLRDFEKQIFQASYFYYSPDVSKSATYPLKTTKQAYEELTSGKGILVGEKLQQLTIRRVHLAYLETIAQMSFFAPFYVFSGDNFQVFVSAVSSEWVAN